MKQVYFVHRDAGAFERQSDGVEFCVIPELHDEKIYFYCQEYAVFWRVIDEVGDFASACGFSLKGEIRPASLEEVAHAGLLAFVDTVKEYDRVKGRLKAISYIHLK